MSKHHHPHAGTPFRSAERSYLIGRVAVLLLLLGAFAPAAVTASSDWLAVEGRARYDGEETSDARSRAIQDAHREAIYLALAKDLSVEDLFVSLRLSGSIMGAIPCGHVTASKVLKETVVSATNSRGGAPLSEYRVRLQARVSECQSPPPADFSLAAALNQTVFSDGDPVALTLSASKDCHYYVFNILEDERVLRLEPNRLKRDNRLTAGMPLSFPNAADRRLGIRPLAHTPPQASQTTEAIYVLGLRQPVDFSEMGFQEGLFGLYDGRTSFIKALVRVVATIPLDQRAEQLIRYQIKAKTKPD